MESPDSTLLFRNDDYSFDSALLLLDEDSSDEDDVVDDLERSSKSFAVSETFFWGITIFVTASRSFVEFPPLKLAEDVLTIAFGESTPTLPFVDLLRIPSSSSVIDPASSSIPDNAAPSQRLQTLRC